MNQLVLFALRFVLGLFFAVIALRFFSKTASPANVVGLAIILVGLAYFSEYLRNRKKN